MTLEMQSVQRLKSQTTADILFGLVFVLIAKISEGESVTRSRVKC
jgi:hypothetical protein